MKKILFFTTAALFALVSCANDKPIEPGELPSEAQNFLKTHFAAQKIVLATMDRELTHTTYEVTFADGGSVEFDGQGHWKDVECGGTVQPADAATGAVSAPAVVPSEIVPEAIRTHIAANYSGMIVRQINRERRSWEVKLVTPASPAGATAPRPRSIELTFDTAFRLVEIDD